MKPVQHCTSFMHHNTIAENAARQHFKALAEHEASLLRECDDGAADGKGPQGYISGSAPVGSQVYLPAQAAQNSAQAAVPANGLSQASSLQDDSAGMNSASQYASSQAAAPLAFTDTSQAASSQAAAPKAFYGSSQAASSQTAGPVAYSGASDVAASGTNAAGASPATSVPNSRLNPGQQRHHAVDGHGLAHCKPWTDWLLRLLDRQHAVNVFSHPWPSVRHMQADASSQVTCTW